MSMQTVMAADLAALWSTEMTTTAIIGVTSYTVLLDDLLSQEVDQFGGPEMENVRSIHFLTTDLASIENGSTLTLLEPSPPSAPSQRKKIVLRSITSADGNELIVTVRGA